MIYYPTEKNKPSDDSELWRSEKLILNGEKLCNIIKINHD